MAGNNDRSVDIARDRDLPAYRRWTCQEYLLIVARKQINSSANADLYSLPHDITILLCRSSEKINKRQSPIRQAHPCFVLVIIAGRCFCTSFIDRSG